MIFNVYVCYNRKLECYERPLFQQDDPDEFIEHIGRDFKASDEATQVKMRELDVIHLGQYDDNTGRIMLGEPNTILSLANFGVKEDASK